MRMDKKRLLWICCPLYLLFFAGDCFLSSYYSLYFLERGMTTEQIAILLGVVPFALFLGCFVLSPFAKNPKRALWLYRFCALAEVGFILGYAFCTEFVPLLVLTFFVGFFNSAPFSFLEGYVAPLAKHDGVPYSSIRLFGTAGYAVALVIGYFFLQSFPVQNCCYFAVALFAVSFVFSFLLRDHPHKAGEQQETEASKPLFSKSFVFFLLFGLFFIGSFNAMAYVLPIRLSFLGMSDADYSLCRGIGIITELILMIFIPLFPPLRKAKKGPLFVAGAFILIGTSFGIYFAEANALGYLNLVFSGLGKGFFFAFMSLFLLDIVGEKNLPKAMTLLLGCEHMASTLLNLLSNTIYENLTFPGYFALICGLELIGIVFLVFAKGPKENAAQ